MFECLKLKSVLGYLDIIVIKIRKECDVGRFVGLFIILLFRNFCMFFFGLVFKKDLNEYCLIYYLFFLEGFLVNDFIFDCCVMV